MVNGKCEHLSWKRWPGGTFTPTGRGHEAGNTASGVQKKLFIVQENVKYDRHHVAYVGLELRWWVTY